MSRSQALKALVTERLTAAAEEIFVLFERTIAKYEQELCLYKEEKERSFKGLRSRAGVQMSSLSPGSSLNEEITETPQIKEEPEQHSVKQEGQLPMCVLESSAVYVKREESSLLQQIQTEHQTQGEDISSEPHFHSETEGHTEHFPDTENDHDWEPPFSYAVQMETEADGVHYNQVQTRGRSTAAHNSVLFPKNKSAPETSASVNDGHTSGAEKNEVDCPFCQKRFNSKLELQMHIRVHTGDKPFICSICEKRFADKSNLRSHIRTHSDEKPFSCSICEKAFTRNGTLRLHMRIHTGEKPYSCSACTKTFTRKDHLRSHKRTHRDGDFSFEETLQLFNL